MNQPSARAVFSYPRKATSGQWSHRHALGRGIGGRHGR
jgi:hypothetical protein